MPEREEEDRMPRREEEDLTAIREEEDLTLRNVYIAQDLTPGQREEQKELRRRRKS